jgi:DNA-binding beta-propeller fold protein YncE
MLQLKLCAYCNICVSTTCVPLSTPSEARKMIQQQVRNSLAQLGGALSLQAEGAAQATNPLPGFVLNTSLSELRPGGGFSQAPNTIDFLDVDGIEVVDRLDIDAGLPDAFYEPQDMALTEDGQTLVVVSRGAPREFFPDGPAAHLTIVDVPSRRLIRRIMFSTQESPSNLVLSPDGRRAYMSSGTVPQSFLEKAELVEVDLTSDRILRRLELPTGQSRAGELVMTPDGAQIVVLLAPGTAALTMPKLAVVDTATMTISAVYPRPDTDFTMRRRFATGDASQLAMDPAGNQVYVGDIRAFQTPEDTTTLGIAVFDVATAEVSRIIPVPGKESGGDDDLQLYLDGMAIAATDARTGSVFGIDVPTGEVRFVEKVADTFFETELLAAP